LYDRATVAAAGELGDGLLDPDFRHQNGDSVEYGAARDATIAR
jgi:hypothetical protein